MIYLFVVFLSFASVGWAGELPARCPNLSAGWDGTPCLGFMSGDKLSSTREYLIDELKIDHWLIREAVIYVDAQRDVAFMFPCQWQLEAAMRTMDRFVISHNERVRKYPNDPPLKHPDDINRAMELWHRAEHDCWRNP